MKKKILTLAIAAAMVISMMASCNKSGDNNGSSDNGGSVGNASSVNAGDTDNSNDLFSFQISIDGNTYTLPCAYSEFAANGWELDGEDGTLKSNTQLIAQKLKNGDKSIMVSIYNSTSEAINYSDGAVTKVKVSLECANPVLPGNFVFDENTTVDDVIAKYGEPNEQYDTDNGVVLTYKKDITQKVEFTIYSQDSGMTKSSSVTVYNME